MARWSELAVEVSVTLSRRSFSFASLAALLGVSRTARADVPEAQAPVQQAPNAIPEVAAAPHVSVTPSVTLVGKQLALTVRVRNDGPEAIAVQTKLGSRPAGEHALLVEANGVEVELERQLGEVDRREMISRMGPMPTFVNIASGQTVEVGPVLFAAPAKVGRLRARGSLYVRMGDFPVVSYDVSGLAVGGKKS